ASRHLEADRRGGDMLNIDMYAERLLAGADSILDAGDRCPFEQREQRPGGEDGRAPAAEPRRRLRLAHDQRNAAGAPGRKARLVVRIGSHEATRRSSTLRL